MAIKAGQILHYGGTTLIDRIQTGGASNLGIPETKVYELGNELTVATLRDNPDLTFDLESLDVTTEIEALLTHVDPTTVVDGDKFVFTDAVPLDIVSPYKDRYGSFTTVRGVALPYLTLERAQYRFGVRANATQSFTLRGDSIYYVQGTPYFQRFNAAGVGPYNFAHTALPTVEKGADVFAYCVTLILSDGSYQRLFHGVDYTNTSAGFTLVVAAPVGSHLEVVYGSTTPLAVPQATHPLDAVKPAGIRARDIDVIISDGAATPTMLRWAGVQSAEATWGVTLEQEEELGNPHTTATDYDVPTVNGNVVVRAVNPTVLWDKIAQVGGVETGDTINALSSVPLEMEVRISHPVTGDRLKTLYVPDARFQPPPLQGRVQQKLDATFTWTSDTGLMEVYAGEKP